MMHIGAAKPETLWPESYEQLDAQDRREMWEAYRAWYGVGADYHFGLVHDMSEHEARLLHEQSTERDGTNYHPKGA